MELLSFFRQLVKRPLAVALGALVAVACGVAATATIGGGLSGASGSQTWSSMVETQVDTPQPLVADGSASAATIQTQTVLLADYLSTSEAQASIARGAGLAPEELTVISPPPHLSSRRSALVRAAHSSAGPSTPYVVSAVAWAYSPLLTLVATGPDQRTVARLSEQATRVLESGPVSSAQRTRPRLTVRQLGPAQVTVTTSPVPGPLMGVAVGVFVFGTWCFALVVVVGLAGALRRNRRPSPAAAG